jgi:peptide/nickel transport system substrate-binding protein
MNSPFYFKGTLLLLTTAMILGGCGDAAGFNPVVIERFESSEISMRERTTFVNVTFGEPNLLDPALSYDTFSAEIIQNVYEGLVFFDGESTSDVVPQLARSYQISPDGLEYAFTLRRDIEFHNGAALDVDDVVYSFVRGMLQGGYSSPQFLLVEPFFGVGKVDVGQLVDEAAEQEAVEAYTAFLSEGGSPEEFPFSDAEKKVEFAAFLARGGDPNDFDFVTNVIYDPDNLKEMNSSVLAKVCESAYAKFSVDEKANSVTMKLATPWGPFLPTIAQSWGAILDKDWAIENGAWDGSCNTWQEWYAILEADDTLAEITNGTGPFALENWIRGQELVLVRNENYWREPARLERVVYKQADEWGTRFAMLQAGDADFVQVPVENRSQMDTLVGDRCLWQEGEGRYQCEIVDETRPLRLYQGRPGINRTDIFFNFDVANPDDMNPYIGSGKLDGRGIPVDFFRDTHIRKAFNYCFDWDEYIENIFEGEAVQSKSLALPGMPGYTENEPTYHLDLAKCEAEFKLADVDQDGIPAGEDPDDVWAVGFRMSGIYNYGNTTRQKLVEILANNLSQVNEKFVVESIGLSWPVFLRTLRARVMPLIFVGWQEDIHDPHNWYVPYLQTTFAQQQSLPVEMQAVFGDYINRGVVAMDKAERNQIYMELNRFVFNDPPFILLAIPTDYKYIHRNVQGLVLNPLLGGFYFYPVYKENIYSQP